MNTIGSSSPLNELAQQLVRTFDTNGDGSLTPQEFTSFLTSFVGSLGSGSSARAASLGSSNPARSGGSPMEGFDFRKIGDPNVSTVKYKFARVAQNWSLNSVMDMGSAESLLNSMRSELEANGVTVLAVSKDKLQILDDGGNPGWVDVIRGAGGPDPAWQWGGV